MWMVVTILRVYLKPMSLYERDDITQTDICKTKDQYFVDMHRTISIDTSREVHRQTSIQNSLFEATTTCWGRLSNLWPFHAWLTHTSADHI